VNSGYAITELIAASKNETLRLQPTCSSLGRSNQITSIAQ
jgi:hypothetical protein